MKLENDKIDQITIIENVDELNKLNRGVTSIIAWVGKSIGKWILKQGLGALKDIVLGKNGDPMKEIMQAVEELINQRLTQLKKLELEAEYKGFIDAIDRLQDAINLVKKYENDKTRKGIEELIKAKDVIKHQISTLDILFTQRLPQFEISGYEGVSLPLFVPIATLHLTLLKDAVLNGEKWGLDADSIKYYQNSFNKLVLEYTKRAINLYNAERNRRDANEIFILKNAMKETLNLIYLWSLYQYEGINPTFSQSYWSTEGGLPALPSNYDKGWEKIYTIANGPTNGFIRNIRYFLTNRAPLELSNDDYLHGIDPYYDNHNKYAQQTGLLGSPGNKGGYGSIPSWKSNFYFGDIHTTKKWLVIIDGKLVLHNGRGSRLAPPTRDYYEDHFIRTFSYIPYNINKISQFSMADPLSLHDTPNLMVRGNVVLGFAPNSTKTFFEKGKHFIPKESSYTIPALQFYDIDPANKAFLKEYLEQGTDGGLGIMGNNTDETCIHYRINLENISENQEYKTLLRLRGTGTVRMFINLDGNNRIQVGEVKITDFSDWKDYFIEGPLPKHLQNKQDVNLVINVGTSQVYFSHLILIPKNNFKTLIPK